MNIEFELILHPRVVRYCKKLYTDGQWKHAAKEAMDQVEMALKEKSGFINPSLSGVTLISKVFGEKGKGLKLVVPFGEGYQQYAEKYFSGTFSYYRNYAAHDGRKIDRPLCLRIMIIASDLLDLIAACHKKLIGIDGYEDLINTGLFPSKESILDLIILMDGYIFPDLVIDGFFEDFEEMLIKGFTKEQYEAMFDYGLMEYIEEPCTPNYKEDDWPDTLGHFQITKYGEFLAKKIKKDAT